MRILVGITGGVAAYKSAELIRLYIEAGHEVQVVPTANALRFIGAATLEALSHRPVSSELFSDVSEVKHIELAKWAEKVVVAPATASFIARLAAGLADDLLGNILLATLAPITIAPAMHTEMWNNAATAANLETLKARGIRVIEPSVGRLTGEDTGVGRLPEAKSIFNSTFEDSVVRDLFGKRILVIAGGTREPIDAVRYIGNRSSGKQGIEIALEASARGAEVALIGANFDFSYPGIKFIPVETTLELQGAVDRLGYDFDFIIMPAAVSDYRVTDPTIGKLKKQDIGANFDLHLTQNPDIIASIAQMVRGATKIVGFAAETFDGDYLIQAARGKLLSKSLHLVVANDVSNGRGFDSTENSVIFVSETDTRAFAGTKREIATQLFNLLLSSK